MRIEKDIFGYLPSGEQADIYTITMDGGLKAKITNYGGILTSLEIPDKVGNTDDIVLGFDNLEQYLGEHPYFGAIIGRYGNRIGGARFEIDGVEYKLSANENSNSLHGGNEKPFHRVLWDTEEIQSDDSISLKFSHTSNDNADGFPGNLKVEVLYSFTNENEFKISYQAESDKATHVNLTHHSYFNLTGCKENIFSHEISIESEHVTEVDDAMVPTGNLMSIKDSPLDLLSLKQMGEQIEILDSKGFDHNYVVKGNGKALSFVSKVHEPKSGRVMEVFSSEPGVQFYSGNYIGDIVGKNKTRYADFSGFCLETQHYPDSPNKQHFPSTLLKPGEVYKSETVYKFSAIK